jgi:hypothetical protein
MVGMADRDDGNALLAHDVARRRGTRLYGGEGEAVAGIDTDHRTVPLDPRPRGGHDFAGAHLGRVERHAGQAMRGQAVALGFHQRPGGRLSQVLRHARGYEHGDHQGTGGLGRNMGGRHGRVRLGI